MLKTALCTSRQPLAVLLCYPFELLGNGLVPLVKDVHMRLEDTYVWTHLQHRAARCCKFNALQAQLHAPEAEDSQQRATGSFSNALKVGWVAAPSGGKTGPAGQTQQPWVSSCLLCYLQHLLSSGHICCNSQVALLLEHELQQPPAQGIL